MTFQTAAILTCTLLAGFVFAAPLAAAEKIKYKADPAYEKMAPGDSHPMDDMIALAEGGDLRAQFILGDLYSKGKGGLKRNTTKARHWFEQSAYNGYSASFIRLAALDKRAKKPEEAYKWYTLCIEEMNSASRKWCDTSRDALVKSAKLDRAQIKAAKKKADSWHQDKKAALEAVAAPKDNKKEGGNKKTDAGDHALPPKSEKEVLTAAEALTLNPPQKDTAPETPKTTTAAEAIEETTKTTKE